MEDKGLLDLQDEAAPANGAISPLEIYKMQRAHFTKMVETLYRSIPFYIVIVGAIWAYGFALHEHAKSGDDYTAALVMLAACIVSFAFGHLVDRFGRRMYETWDNVKRLEGNLAPPRNPDPKPALWIEREGKKHLDLAAAQKRAISWLPIANMHAHEVMALGFYLSGLIALIIASIFMVWTIAGILTAMAALGFVLKTIEKRKSSQEGATTTTERTD